MPPRLGNVKKHLNRDRDTDLLHPWLLNQTIEEFSFSVYRVPDSFKSMTTVGVYQMLFYCTDFICRFWRNITCSDFYNLLFIDDLDNTFDILFGSRILTILSMFLTGILNQKVGFSKKGRVPILKTSFYRKQIAKEPLFIKGPGNSSWGHSG